MPEDRKRSLEADERLAVEESTRLARLEEAAQRNAMELEPRRGEKRRSEDEPDDGGRGGAPVGEVDLEEEWEDEDFDTYDERSGELLDPALVKRARK